MYVSGITCFIADTDSCVQLCVCVCDWVRVVTPATTVFATYFENSTRRDFSQSRNNPLMSTILEFHIKISTYFTDSQLTIQFPNCVFVTYEHYFQIHKLLVWHNKAEVLNKCVPEQKNHCLPYITSWSCMELPDIII